MTRLYQRFWFDDPDTGERHELLMTAAEMDMIPAGWISCKCTRTELREDVNRAGVRVWKHQCLDCGRGVGSQVKRDDKAFPPPPFDRGAYDRLTQAARAKREAYLRQFIARTEERHGERRRAYQEYLQTPKWRDKRDRVLERDGGICQACLRNRASEVHHKTYANIYDEPAFDLISVCGPCHRKLHGRHE